MNIKKIMAREGLIIVSILLLLLGNTFMPSYFVVKNIKLKIDSATQELLKIRDKKTGEMFTLIVDKKIVEGIDEENRMMELRKEGEFLTRSEFNEIDNKGFSPEQIAEVDKKYRSIKNSDPDVVRCEVPLENLKTNIFLFLLFAYPIYLLIRFILWAIRTLKDKH